LYQGTGLEELLAGDGSANGPLAKFWHAVVPWVGRAIMGLDGIVSYETNGSGDRTFDWIQQWCFLVLALASGLVWVWFDRKRRADRVIYEGLRVMVRYFLGLTMLFYGVAKISLGQFPAPGVDRLTQSYGESSPMGLLWTFMGYSPAYNLFTGLIESTGGILLFFRRTTTLGALMVTAAMANVVMLNFCFDVPVKLFSTNLLFFALFLLASDFRRLAGAFVLNRPTEAFPLTRNWPKRWMRPVAIGLKVVILGLLAALIMSMWSQPAQYRAKMPRLEIAGFYEVETFSRDGEVIPPVLTDGTRWRIMSFRGGGVRVENMDKTSQYFRAKKDSAKDALTLETTGSKTNSFVLQYARPTPEQLRMEGEMDGHALVLQLRRIDEKKFLLTNRGFHWINEYPFNR
jgi:hypothetical protein